MNILIPHHWLLDHLKTKATPKQIQECLSLCGPSVERIETVRNDSVYDIEVTTNRVDMMSVRGIAREAAAILPEFGLKARLKPLRLGDQTSRKLLDIKIKNNPKLCRRILAVKLSDVTIGQSPSWLSERLEKVGQRPLLNAIDITNYVMWEIGHPIHVFDYDRLTRKTIIVREARKGETLTTLDGKKHQLKGGEVIFDDGSGEIIDLPGIMGTENSVVTEKTTNILLWIESIEAEKIRNASMNLAIRSQAAVLNEKGVDNELGMDAIRRAVDLATEVTKASVDSKITDIYPTQPSLSPISLDQHKLDVYTGIKLPPQRVIRILTNLGCRVTHHPSRLNARTEKTGDYTVTPPSWRSQDLTIAQDVIEEIARIYGYFNLPSRLMEGEIPLISQGIPFHLEDKIKDHLVDWGFTEVYTNSLVSKQLAQWSGFALKTHLSVSNPLSEDQVYLRRSLIPSHLEVMKSNEVRGRRSIFEIAHVYYPRLGKKLPHEKLKLVMTTDGPLSAIKATVTMLLEKLRINYQFPPRNGAWVLTNPARSTAISAADRIVGRLGELNASHLEAFQLNSVISVAEFNLKALQGLVRTHPAYQVLPQYPPLIEDLTFIFPEKTYLGQVIEEMTSLSRLVESVVLKETYQRNSTFTITYRHPDRSLTDKDISPVRIKIKTFLEKYFRAKLIGTL